MDIHGKVKLIVQAPQILTVVGDEGWHFGINYFGGRIENHCHVVGKVIADVEI